MKEDLNIGLELPEGVSATYQDGVLSVKGPKGEVAKVLKNPRVEIKIDGKKISIISKRATKREKCIVNTFASHVKNMMNGVQEPYVYKLKICSGHFPMNVSVQGDQFIVKNFLGEKSPRTLRLKGDAKVVVKGDTIEVESCDKEAAGRAASDIELLMRVGGRDRRIFQDGIYLIVKAGKEVAGK